MLLAKRDVVVRDIHRGAVGIVLSSSRRRKPRGSFSPETCPCSLQQLPDQLLPVVRIDHAQETEMVNRGPTDGCNKNEACVEPLGHVVGVQAAVAKEAAREEEPAEICLHRGSCIRAFQATPWPTRGVEVTFDSQQQLRVLEDERLPRADSAPHQFGFSVRRRGAQPEDKRT